MKPCTRCSASSETCTHCKRPLCWDHRSLRGACNECDLAYFASRDRVHFKAWFGIGFLVPWIAFAAVMANAELPRFAGGVRAFSTGSPRVDLAIMTLIVAVFCGKALVAMRRGLHRHRFTRTPFAAPQPGPPYR